MKYEQKVQVETSEYICFVKRIDGVVAQKTLEQELIRCKDCYFYIDGYCDNNVIYQMMSGDLIGVHFEPHGDFYCAMAERKEE